MNEQYKVLMTFALAIFVASIFIGGLFYLPTSFSNLGFSKTEINNLLLGFTVAIILLYLITEVFIFGEEIRYEL